MQRAIDDLVTFYQQPCGVHVRRLLTHRLRARWRTVEGMTVMGLGYALPYLGTFRGEACRLGALLPMTGVSVPWPDEGALRTVLVEDTALPLPDSSVDRMLAVHALEFSENRRQVLREIWRVMAPEGKLLIVLPNRNGFWANRDKTPFGKGEPYSRRQIERLLNASMFSVEHYAVALAMPPIAVRLPWQPGPGFERMGCSLWPRLAGVHIIEVSKRVVAILPKAQRRRLAVRLRPMVSPPIRLPRAA